jgi:hypothetical protein
VETFRPKPSPIMQFRNLVNEPTFHFFSWITRGDGATALPGLIAKAFDQVEETQWSSKENVCTAACEKLADLLEAHVLDFLGEGGWIGDVDGSEESHTWPGWSEPRAKSTSGRLPSLC